MNETINTIMDRRAVRTFDDRKVEREKIEEIVKAGLYAPSGAGRQDSVIIVIEDRKKLDEIRALNASVMGKENIDPFYGAPVVILVADKKGSSTALLDGAASIENMLIAATSLGLGTCWIHRAKEELETEWGKKLLSSLGLDDEYIGVGHIALGYYDESRKPQAKERKDGRLFFI